MEPNRTVPIKHMLPLPELLLSPRNEETGSCIPCSVEQKRHYLVWKRSVNATKAELDVVKEAVSNYEQLLRRNVKRFRGGLVYKARRLVYQSTLGSRVIKKKEKKRSVDATEA